MLTDYQFDALDHRILQELSVNARIAYSALADQLKVSNSLIHQRIKKLQESGVLEQPVYQLNSEILGYETSAFTQIMVTNNRFIKDIITALEDIPEIVECVNIAGRYALLVRLYARNNTHLRDVIYDRIQPITGVEGTNTTFAFETSFRRPISVGRSQG